MKINCLGCGRKFAPVTNRQRASKRGTCSEKCYHAHRMNLQAKRRLTAIPESIKNHPRLNLRDSAVRKGRKTHKSTVKRKRLTVI